MAKADILAAFAVAFPEGQGNIECERALAVLRILLPRADDEELELLLNAVSFSEDRTMRVDEFVDFLIGEENGGRTNKFSASVLHGPAGSGATHCNAAVGLPKMRTFQQDAYIPASANLQDADVLASVDMQFAGDVERSTSPTSSCPMCGGQNAALMFAEAARELLPKRVILVRHGESEGNVDASVYRAHADNALELTARGSQQALEAGRRIKNIIGDDRVYTFVSPFQRTLQTARNIAVAIDSNVGQGAHGLGGMEKEPRIREQEFGNLQGDDFVKFREEQHIVGRYFYRWPTGESGADVHARVKGWWEGSLLPLNLRPKRGHVDTVVVVTHGLTMRFILMQLFNWSPNTFHTIYNAGNCDIYVLKRDLSLPGHSPYRLDPQEGDMPRSTASLLVEFRSGEKKVLRLDDYLSIPEPRTRRPDIARQMLAAQHGIDPADVVSIDFYGGRFSKYR